MAQAMLSLSGASCPCSCFPYIASSSCAALMAPPGLQIPDKPWPSLLPPHCSAKNGPKIPVPATKGTHSQELEYSGRHTRFLQSPVQQSTESNQETAISILATQPPADWQRVGRSWSHRGWCTRLGCICQRARQTGAFRGSRKALRQAVLTEPLITAR